MTHSYSVSRSFSYFDSIFIYFRLKENNQMPDYLGEDQRKTKQKDDKEEDKPIKGKT
jgi:hypothetical protein